MFWMLSEIWKNNRDNISSKINLYKQFILKTRENNLEHQQVIESIEPDQLLKVAGYMAFYYIFCAIDEYNEELSNDRSLAAYLQTIALITSLDEEKEGSDYVTLMSIHSAKGLEFDAVIVGGLEENLFPSYMSMSSPEQLDEERRLFYVAITRAKQFLTLSYARTRYFFGNLKTNDPSRFIE